MSKRKTTTFYAFEDFRSIVRAWAESRGRGEYRRIARELGMHTTLLSQVMGGRKILTEEQAVRLCEHMGLADLERDYFLKLVQIERAGSENLKAVYSRHLRQLRDQANKAINWVPESKAMTEADNAIYYSNWQYSAVRLLTSIEQFQTVDAISSHLNLPASRVREILGFLVRRQLCKREANEKYVRTQRNTHIEANSPMSTRHHQNWRAKSIGLLESLSASDLAFTSPVSISKKDVPNVREVLLKAISEIAKIVEQSPAEEIAYLGIDWMELR